MGAKRPTLLVVPKDDFRLARIYRDHIDDYPWQMRSFALQELLKHLDKSGDPHDHMATYKQVVHAEQVIDTDTQIEGSGLTFKRRALT